MLAGKADSLVVSGSRAWDMALRLKYAGVDAAPAVEPDWPAEGAFVAEKLSVAAGQNQSG